MIINYSISKTERKQLVAAISEFAGGGAKYLGAPSFAYRVEGFTVGPDGTVTVDNVFEAAPLIRFLRGKGFQAEDPLAGCIADDDEDPDPDGEGPSPEGDDGDEEESGTDGECGICISLPRSRFTDGSLDNLKAIVAAKGNLIRKALGTDDLPVEVTDTKVSFPWLPGTADPDRLKACETFIRKLCEMARNQKRVTAKEKDGTNEKYAFRCFLLRLGFIGAEYGTDRKILLENLTGNSAFRSGRPKKDESAV